MDNKRVKPEYRVRHAAVYAVLERHKGESLRSAEVAAALRDALTAGLQ